MLSSRLLLVADDQPLAHAIQTHLQKALGQPAGVCSFDSVLDHLATEPVELLLLAAASAADVNQVLPLVREIIPPARLPMVLIVESQLAACHSELNGLDGQLAGHFRWPEQVFGLTDLLKTRLNPTRKTAVPSESALRETIGRQLRTRTPSLVSLAEGLALAAAHDVPVLLTGETGTGKTYLARLIHEHSARKDERLVVVPCGSLVANLVESELFGHVKGAFTGADRAKAGKFEAVGGGTLLLDEIDTLGLEQQAKLLRVIETGEYEPVGSNEVKHCAARFIIASNWDLEEAVESGKFRSDLYYRMNVMAFHLPPLRERVGDVLPLATAMMGRFSEKFHKELTGISPEAGAALEAFPWPGNIRQLENVIQRAVLSCSGPELLREHLPEALQETGYAEVYVPPALSDSLMDSRQNVERNVIQRALATHQYSRARTAQALGISRVTLYKKMKKYGLMDLPRHTAQAV